MMAAITAATLGFGASSASAVVADLANGQSLSYQPAPNRSSAVPPTTFSGATGARAFDSFFTNLDYGGGPIMTSNTDYTVYWRPSGATAYPSGFKTGVNTFFKDLEHDSGGDQNVDSVATQYNNAAGEFVKYQTTFGGELIDEDPYPANGCTRAPKCLTDAQLRTELVKFVSEQKLPTDLSHEYFLLTPEGVESCFEEGPEAECSANAKEHQAYCAYHGSISLGGGSELVYANDPFVDNKECDEPTHHINGSSDSALFGGLSHEHNESITDPEPNNAWTDWGEEFTGEDGDKCRTFEEESEFGEPLGEVEVGGEPLTYNQEINGHKYWYQQEWSNKGAECLQRLTFNTSEAPAGRFSAAAGGGTLIAFDAAGSTAGAGVRYSLQFNDREGHLENETLETSSQKFTYEFPATGTYTVAMTVLKSDGTSFGVAHAITVGGPGPTSKIAVTTPAPTAGQPVAFNGAESIDPPGGTVGSYTWQFGDGSEGAGATPSHTYAAAGTYTAKLTVVGSDGLTASTTRLVGVAVPSGEGGGGGGGGGGGATPPNTTPTTSPTTITPTTSTTITTAPAPSTDSSFTAKLAPNATRGTIVLTVSVLDPGKLSWGATFANGKFGAFASSAKCKKGQLRLRGRCLPATIAFARGSRVLAAAGSVAITLKPSSSALKALKAALKQRKGVPVSIVLSFQSARGGAPVSHVQTVAVKLRR
jgi:PKD repeat protein